MFSWLPRRRRVRMDRVEAEAEALIRELGFAAYSEARRREYESSGDVMARDWSRVALVVAQKTGKRVGVDATNLMAISAYFVPDREAVPTHGPRPFSEPSWVEEQVDILPAKSPLFRIVFLGRAASEPRPSVLKEVEIQASDLSAAIVAAADIAWPPRTIGLRILDHEGREVFGRQKGGRRPSLE